MCWLSRLLGIAKSPEIGDVDGSSPRIYENTPSPAYLQGRMPTYNVSDLIKHLEYRIQIHESYTGLVEDDPATWSAYGSAEYHQWAIEGYENSIFYLNKLRR
jgi:hypothetical protein